MESQFVNKKLKQWGVHGQGPSNINCSSVVFICDDYRLNNNSKPKIANYSIQFSSRRNLYRDFVIW